MDVCYSAVTSLFLTALLLFCGEGSAWDTENAAVHQRVQEYMEENMEFMDQRREILEAEQATRHENGTLSPLENTPKDLINVLRCIYKSSQHNYWTPAFRLDPDPLQGANTGNRLDLLALIHTQKKLIYVQVPKAASTTIKSHLKQHGFTPLHSMRGLPLGFHWNEYYTFSFVRNPITRFNSAYGTITARVPQQDADYHKFVEELLGNKQRFYASHHSLPQTFFLSDESGLPYELDFVGRVENFNEDWRTLMKHIHVPPPPKQKKNVAEGKPHLLSWLEERASEEDQTAICAYYLSDFLCYEYELPSYCAKVFAGIEPEQLVISNLKVWSHSLYGVA